MTINEAIALSKKIWKTIDKDNLSVVQYDNAERKIIEVLAGPQQPGPHAIYFNTLKTKRPHQIADEMQIKRFDVYLRFEQVPGEATGRYELCSKVLPELLNV